MKNRLWFLAPLAGLYALVMEIRNGLFDRQWWSSVVPTIPSIGVGNLSVGGTGKSVVIDYLISHLKTRNQLAVISRGYGRQTKGFILSDAQSTAKTLGDEPFQFYRKHPDIQVAVAEDRRVALAHLEKMTPKISRLLFDDCFQHRWVKPQKMILTTSYHRPYFSDWVLPVGRLRELSKGRQRADMVLVTKCPKDLSNEAQLAFKRRLKLAPTQPCFFSSIAYAPQLIGHNKTLDINRLAGKKVVLITGIADPGPMVEELRRLKLTFEHFAFGDHHAFTASEIDRFREYAEDFLLVTTEKDYGRLFPQLSDHPRLYYWPISLEFVHPKQEEEFLAWIA